MLQVIVSEHPKPLGRAAATQDTADTLLSLQLIRADPPSRHTGGVRKPRVKFSFAEALPSSDEDGCSTSTHTNTNPPPPVLRTVEQCRVMLREYLSTANPSSIVPAFPLGTDGYAGGSDGKARAVERFYQRLLSWVPEIEQWSGFHEFFSDRDSPLNQPTQKRSLFGQWLKLLSQLLLKKATPIPSLPVHYTCKEAFDLEVDTLTVYKELLAHEASIAELQKRLADRILALCEAGRASQDVAEKLDDLTSIRPIPAGFARRSSLSASIAHDGKEAISPGAEGNVAHDQIKFEEFSSRTTTLFADIECKQQAFIRRITEQVIESLHEHLLDFANAKAGALKKTAEARLRKLELSAGAGNAAVMSEATRSYDQECTSTRAAIAEFCKADRLVYEQLGLFMERSKAIVLDLIGLYEDEKAKMEGECDILMQAFQAAA